MCMCSNSHVEIEYASFFTTWNHCICRVSESLRIAVRRGVIAYARSLAREKLEEERDPAAMAMVVTNQPTNQLGFVCGDFFLT